MIAFILGLLCTALSCGTATADDATAQFLHGLRQRELFSLAEGYCLRKLAEEGLPQSERIAFTLELSRTYCDHAQQVVGPEQDDLWQRARDTVTREIENVGDTPLRLPLEVQLLLVSAAQAEHLRWQWELSPYDDRIKNQSFAILANVIPQLKAKETSVDDQLRKANPHSSKADDRFGVRELRSLLFHVRRRLTTALLDQALLLPKGSSDRTAALLDAERYAKRLDSGVLSLEAGHDRDLLLAQTKRLQGDYRQPDLILQKLEKSTLEPIDADRVTAERVRLLLDEGKATEAATLLNQKGQSPGSLNEELRFLLIRSLAAMRNLAREKGQTELADELKKQIERRISAAGSDSNSYWANRSQRLFNRLDTTDVLGDELVGMIGRARSLYASGDVIAAESAYREAADASAKAGHDDTAMDLAYTAASIQMKREDLEGAARAFLGLSNKFPKHPPSANAHLVGAYCLGKLLEQERVSGDPSAVASRREAYAAALREHRTRFAGHPTAVDATWMLATLEESTQQTSVALSLYREIPAGHVKGPEAQVAIVRCYEQILERLRSQGQPAHSWHVAAVEELKRIVALYPKTDAKLSRFQAEVCERLARILLGLDQPDFVAADQLLERVMAATRSAEIPDGEAGQTERTHWQELWQTATHLKIVALAGQRRWEDAVRLLDSLPANSPDDLLRVLQGLSDASRKRDSAMRAALGELQLAACKRLQREFRDLNPQQTARLLACRAQGYTATNQLKLAVSTYDELLKRSPQDKSLLQTAARLCLDIGTPEYFDKAKSLWRRVERLSVPGGTEWMEARYHIAYCCYQLEDYETCEKLLAVTHLLYAELPDASLREKFRQLERDVKDRRKQE